ncbi:LuxR C-terminal-related transcriptional regulator [Kitasatospora sp. NPDC056138]|uniref:helix-turn-helix transcriptional regulator n=1 Tax=Kitasatospora sp. NPDC056138 TaxID=3345724 RepID=UPI0035DF535B
MSSNHTSENEVKSSLACLGVNPHAEMVYRAMLGHPRWSVRGLAEELRIEEDEVRSGLDELARTALVRASWDAPELVTAVKPSIGLAALIAAQQKDLLERQRKLDEGRSIMADLMVEYDSAQGTQQSGGIEYLPGLDSVRTRIEELSRDVQTEVLALIPRAALSVEGMEASKALDEEILARGVTVRTVYLDSVRNHSTTRQYARWLTGLGGAVRTVPALPMRIIVIDRKVAVLPIDPEESSKGALLLREPSVIAAILVLFEKIWETACPLGTSDQRDDQGLSAQERELLRLLASGMTDEVAGRHLGLSLRSVRRLMSDMMARLEARSRFEAGVRAAERGWI